MRNAILGIVMMGMVTSPVNANPNSNVESEIASTLLVAALALSVKAVQIVAEEIENYQENREIDKVEVIRQENEVCDENGMCVTTITVKTTSHVREKN